MSNIINYPHQKKKKSSPKKLYVHVNELVTPTKDEFKEGPGHPPS
jgi:hypothetical protein